MPLEHASDVALRNCVFERRFRVEVRAGRVRPASPWRALALEDPARLGDTG